MSDKTKQTLYTVSALIVIAFYIVGMVLMIAKQAQIGIALWVASTVFGALLLYVRRTRQKIKADAEAEEAEEAARMKGEKTDANA